MFVVQIEDYQLCGVIIFLLALCGSTANWIVSLLAARVPTLRNPFGRLSCSQATAEAIILSVFTWFAAPMCFLNKKSWEDFSKHLGFVNLVAYDICCWSHLFISINRFCAIFFPLRYDAIFSKRNTRILIAVSWIAPMVVCTYLFQVRDCALYFNTDLNIFVFTTTQECQFIAWYVDFYKDISIVALISVFDISTIIKVRLTNDKAIMQGVIFVCELLTYFIFAWMFKDKFATFALTTVAWILVHSGDGFIILMFNRGFMKVLRATIRNTRVSTTHGTNQHGSQQCEGNSATHPSTISKVDQRQLTITGA